MLYNYPVYMQFSVLFTLNGRTCVLCLTAINQFYAIIQYADNQYCLSPGVCLSYCCISSEHLLHSRYLEILSRIEKKELRWLYEQTECSTLKDMFYLVNP